MLKRKINILTVGQKSPTYEHDFQELLFPAGDMKCRNNENFIGTRAVPKIKTLQLFKKGFPASERKSSVRGYVERCFKDNNENVIGTRAIPKIKMFTAVSRRVLLQLSVRSKFNVER